MNKYKILKIATVSLVLLSPIHIARAENAPIINLDLAHLDSEWDNGATYNGKNEREIANEISQMVGEKLESYGMKIKYTRDVNTPISIADRVYKTNKNGNDYYLSIHLNTSESRQGVGIESWNSGNDILTKNITSGLSEALGLIHRGDFESPYYNSRINGDTSILELGFLDSSDIHIIENNKNKIADIISRKIANYYGYNQEQIYRVRKCFENNSDQLGAFRNKENAIKLAIKNPTYRVFDSFGNLIY